jgi:hypothetical protein
MVGLRETTIKVIKDSKDVLDDFDGGLIRTKSEVSPPILCR